QDLAARVDGDLLGQVALGDRGGDLGDVADLAGQVVGHAVDVLGQLAPDPRDPADPGLTAEHALAADLAGDPGDLVGERAELIDHRVDGVLELQDLAADLDVDGPGQVALRDRGGHPGDLADLTGQAAGHQVDRVGQILPRATDAAHSTLRAEPALDADLHRDPGQLRVELAELRVHVVDGPGVAEELAAERQIGALLVRALAQVALGDRGHDPRDLAHVVGQAVEHGVLRVDQRAPT